MKGNAAWFESYVFNEFRDDYTVNESNSFGDKSVN